MKKYFKKSYHFSRIIFRLVIGVPFITISLIGNSIVLVFATAFYYIEKDINPKIQSFMDALWWSFATTTTVGYGDVTPITNLGRTVGIALMLIGVAIFAIYTALFARAIIDDDSYMS